MGRREKRPTESASWAPYAGTSRELARAGSWPGYGIRYSTGICSTPAYITHILIYDESRLGLYLFFRPDYHRTPRLFSMK